MSMNHRNIRASSSELKEITESQVETQEHEIIRKIAYQLWQKKFSENAQENWLEAERIFRNISQSVKKTSES